MKKECSYENFFRISPKISFNQNCFRTRKGYGKKDKSYYLVGLKPFMAYGVKDTDGIRTRFWKNVDRICSECYGERGGDRRKYRNEHGCYIFTWGNTPIYIGLAKGAKGFLQECFAKHKREKIKEFFSSKNILAKKKQNYLHLYLIFWNGTKAKDLTQIVDSIETYLITTAIQAGHYDDLLNTNKKKFQWGIGGFYGNEDHLKCVKGYNKKEKECLDNLKKVFKMKK